MNKKTGNYLRYRLVSFFILLALGFILTRIFALSVLKHSFYTALAQDQHQVLAKLVPKRGTIFIQEKGEIYHPLATNRDYQTVFLVPKEIEDKELAAEKLSGLLGVAPDEILKKLSDPNDPYEPLKSKLEDETAAQIKKLKLKGVHLTSESWRWYPQNNLASHILGFVGVRDSQKIGQYGLESYYENELAGQSGFLKSEKDALGRWLLLSDYNLEPAQDGANLYLTLDQNIQYFVEQKLKAVKEKWGAAGGNVIIMEPKTGAIRAMSSLPDFNPNEYNKIKEINVFLNTCIQKIYEPGSVFKPITMAAALDSNKVSPQTTFVDTGSITIGNYTIQNAQNKVYGLSTMTQVLEKSINTGAVFAGRQIGGEVFQKYIEAFEFDKLTGIDLTGEISGNLTNLKEGREIGYATAAFGQGIAITPLQIVTALGAIANEGKMMKPYLVEKITYPDGKESKTQPEIIAHPISPQTANKLTAMLVSTVRNGYDKIKISNYFIAGKTGTAQIPNANSRGYSEDTIHTFIGYAPAYNPKFLIYLKLEQPHGIRFASESLSSVFAEIAQYLFNYYQIAPDE